LDYIRTADRRAKPRPPKPDNTTAAVTALLQEARALMRDRQFGAALDLLRSASGPDMTSLEVEAMVDLIRSRLFLVHREQLGDLDATPTVKPGSPSSTELDLRPNAGILLSMVDGTKSVAELISVSGLDPFETVHTICGLIEADVVEIKL
jgi:hypothetical protein